ncbi:DNA polymerase III subunit epsilon [Psychromonas sp. psych-6C06]|uniref:DNA polymerase III subunit epsilon n=1 Tax=Psychromonas sp. psych-6C06 TaxID=2058089 RepID=UPI000C334340|nr:DNA polymerase III subunit epsilon [Psychromonas sp. psych-6C06]PKF63046.1 DNA polymerase III subunit epsilon [Psychromonas sp. psych-6C06]
MNTSKEIRQVVLDTETTGMNKDGTVYLGHRIIEIGCVEVINRRLTGRHYHVYINPGQLVDPEAMAVHGITDEFLQDKPTFEQVADEFIEFIRGADLVIHNAPFDVGFMDQEFRFLNKKTQPTEEISTVTDTLEMAKKMFPGKRNNLDALSDRFGINTQHRVLHGALLDAEILADVYLLMSGGQAKLNLTNNETGEVPTGKQARTSSTPLTIIRASEAEQIAHTERLKLIKDNLWQSS